MSASFYASRSDIAELAESIFSVPELVAWQSYSIPGQPPTRCDGPAEFKELISRGEDLFSLWAPSVMPPPSIRAINLLSGQTRHVVEGCGLYSLHIGYTAEALICSSHLSWFTEAGARAKCSVLPGPDSVDWAKHKKLGSHLASLIRKKMVASAPGRSVLRGAWELHLQGGLLKEHRNAAQTVQPSDA